MPGTRITVSQREVFWEAIREGASQRTAARLAGFSERSAAALMKKPANGRQYAEVRAERVIPDTPIPLDEVCDEAKAALADRTGFLFMKRYFGIELEPWQCVAWEAEEDAWDSVDREFLLENGPPGGGKTTQKVGFVCKRIVVNRAIRCLYISRAHSLAERNTMRTRRALERTTPAVGAEATLAGDFGRFKPKGGGDVWKRDEFVVVQMDGSPIEEKEPTVSAFGFDSEWIGNRIELVVGDDLDSTRSTRNMEIVERNREVFDNELEPRLEPGGLFVVTQQRLGAFDFSAHCRSKVILPEDDGTEDVPEGVVQYRHLTFKAHYEEICEGLDAAEQRRLHAHDAPAWPDGCLLAPKRLGWRDVRKAMNNRQRFKVVYQQEDPGEDDALVQRIWVDGGRGSDGVDYLGCWDHDRAIGEIPDLSGECVSVLTVDPSPTRYWSIQWWVVHVESEQRFLMDLHRERMDAPEFLDWNMTLRAFTGLAEDWYVRSERAGRPISHVIVEINAAQRFMTQYDHFRRWQQTRSVLIVPHSTHRNKADPDYGVQMVAPRWKFGKVRLPGKQGLSRIASLRLVDEVTRWPHSTTDDCVMGQWFLEHNIDHLIVPTNNTARLTVPSWLALEVA